MKKRNQIAQAAVLAVAGVASLNAMAETLPITASVTVDNTIDFTVVGNLSFGTIRALGNDTAGNCAFLKLDPNPTATTALSSTGPGTDTNTACPAAGTAKIQSLDGLVTRPVFTIAGTPQFSSMKITLPTGSTTVSAPLPSTSATFALRDFTAYKTTGTVGVIPLASGVGTIQTDVAGTASFAIGATLATDSDGFTAAENYQNGIAYTGTFNVLVDYN